MRSSFALVLFGFTLLARNVIYIIRHRKKQLGQPVRQFDSSQCHLIAINCKDSPF